ncbi:hypothetical protein N431DRAFT_525389 [Stipitochalara longipes BDJ]|nr:hypothetical protein N431DRAFT_525389 [Stipitochalara longipes BDJ]
MRWQFLSVLSCVLIFITPVLTAFDPLITPKPKAPTAAQLQKRQDDSGPNVYGYINGDVNSPLGCGAGYEWSSESDLGACCNQVSCTNFVFTCVDRSGGIDVCSDGVCGDSLTVLHCKSPEPSCFRYMRITDAQDMSPNYIYRCGTASDDVTVLVTPTNEAAVVQTPGETSTARVSSFLWSTATATRTQGSSSETSGSNSPSNTETASSITGGSFWKYAVIGVGGLVVILLLMVVIFCLWKRNKKIKGVVYGGPGIGHQPIHMQYMSTVDGGSVAGEVSPEKIARTGEWAQSQSGRPLHATSEFDGETLRGSTSGGRY